MTETMPSSVDDAPKQERQNQRQERIEKIKEEMLIIF